jgi:hypothetical protein
MTQSTGGSYTTLAPSTPPPALPGPSPVAGLEAPSRILSDHEVLLEIVRRNLEQHARSVEIPYFSRPSLQLLEIAPAFTRIESYATLAAIVKEVFAFAVSSPDRSKLVAFILPHLLHGCSTKDKIKLLSLALKQPSKRLRKRMAYGILRSSHSREQLCQILTPHRAEQLTRLGSRKLTEIVAKALVLRALEGITTPPSMWGKRYRENNATNRAIARRRINKLDAAVVQGQNLLARLTYLKHKPRGSKASSTPVPAGPLNDALRTLSSIKRGVEKIRNGPRQSYGRLREFINSSTRRLSLECSDGLRLLQSRTLSNKDLWTPELAKKLVDTVRLVPESERLMTPKLREFILAKVRVLGERRSSGRIVISYRGEIINRRRSEYEGASPLTVLLIHEMAHGIQWGHEERPVDWDYSTGEIFSPNNPLIDFAGFLELSGWRVLGTYAESQLIARTAIQLHGKIYPLNRPVREAPSSLENPEAPPIPEPIVFRRGIAEILFYHRVDAEFSLNAYSSTDPFEDFAEAFTEYIVCPDRLIECAPEKFHFMEIHFRKYRAKNDYQRLAAVQQALCRRRSTSTGTFASVS